MLEIAYGGVLGKFPWKFHWKFPISSLHMTICGDGVILQAWLIAKQLWQKFIMIIMWFYVWMYYKFCKSHLVISCWTLKVHIHSHKNSFSIEHCK